MAVKEHKKSRGSSLVVGTNVVLMIVLAIALVVGLQWIGYRYSVRADLTSSGVNSLSEATQNLVEDLETKVRLTSFYFETDLEEEDQERYRAAVSDLLNLYHATNRGQIEVETINPLQDEEQRRQVFKRLQELEKFKGATAGHREAITAFQENVFPRIGDLISGEMELINSFGTLSEHGARLVGQLRQMFTGLQSDLEQVSQELSDAMASDIPAYSAAVNAVRQSYSSTKAVLESIASQGAKLATSEQLSPQVQTYFAEAQGRYEDLLKEIDTQLESLDGLEPIEMEQLFRDLTSETSNPILVETADDAKVVSFSEVWPPVQPGAMATGFEDRRFLGEQKVTSAILQLTTDEKPAVVFVRHGGPPLFMGGFMPGQPPAPYSEMKEQLEDANFSVHEWDLAGQESMPAIEPAPSRVIFVVLRPTPPRNPFQPQPNETPWTPEKLEVLKKAMGENPRTMFLTGYRPSMGPMASGYEYGDYLRSEWGIDAPGDRVLLLLEAVSAGKYLLPRGSHPLYLTDAKFSDHPIVDDLGQLRTIFPLIAPVEQTEEVPEGVTLERLAWMEERESLFSAADLNYYGQQQGNEFLVRNPEDYTGEFTIAFAGEKGESKMVLISAAEFATDQFAMAPEMAFTARGIVVRPRYPGNAAMFINSLHWLNDNTEWMNLGTPIDTSVITIDKDSTEMMTVQALSIVIWPGLAVLGGLLVWFVRRR